MSSFLNALPASRTCQYCGELFAFPSTRRKHQIRHHFQEILADPSAEETLKKTCEMQKALNICCPYCSRYFLTETALQKHKVLCKLRPLEKHRYTCGFCGKTFATKWNKLEHEWVKHRKEPDFFLKFTEEVALQRLEKIYDKESLNCKWCSATFSQSKARILHEWREHRFEEDFFARADVVGFKHLAKPKVDLKSLAPAERERIVRMHYQEFEQIMETECLCQWCGRKFSDKNMRQLHELRYHSTEMDFDEYTDILNWQQKLTVLLKDWTCRWCMVQFRDKTYRQRHELLAHGHLPNFGKYTDIPDWLEKRTFVQTEWNRKQRAKMEQLKAKMTALFQEQKKQAQDKEERVKRKVQKEIELLGKKYEGKSTDEPSEAKTKKLAPEQKLDKLHTSVQALKQGLIRSQIAGLTEYKSESDSGMFSRGSPTYHWTENSVSDVIVRWLAKLCPQQESIGGSGLLEEFKGDICMFDSLATNLPDRLMEENLKEVNILDLNYGNMDGWEEKSECWTRAGKKANVHKFSNFSGCHSIWLKLDVMGEDNPLKDIVYGFKQQVSWEDFDNKPSTNNQRLIFIGVLNQNQYSFFLSMYYTLLEKSLLFSRGPVEFLVFVDPRQYALLTGMEGKPELMMNKVARLRHGSFQMVFSFDFVHREPLESFTPTYGILSGRYRTALQEAGISDRHLYLLHVRPKRETEITFGKCQIDRDDLRLFRFFSELMIRPRIAGTEKRLRTWFGEDLVNKLDSKILERKTSELAFEELIEIFCRVVKPHVDRVGSRKDDIFLKEFDGEITDKIVGTVGQFREGTPTGLHGRKW